MEDGDDDEDDDGRGAEEERRQHHPAEDGDDDEDDEDENEDAEEYDEQNEEDDDDDDEDGDDDEPEESFRVMCDQTDEERREIRQRQRALHKHLMESDDVDVERARAVNNKIFKKVKFTREAVLDGDNLNLIATKASHKMDRMVEVSFFR